MNRLALKGKGLFVFSDPGGAKPILALIKLRKDLNDFLVVSDRHYDFYSDFNIPVQLYTSDCENKLINEFSPDFIFTATSYTSSIELKFIIASKKFNIPSYTFVDHYTDFANRFLLNDVLIYPDTICVIDDKAYLLIMDQKPTSKIIITSNFYHEYLKNWVVPVNKHYFFKKCCIPENNKLIVFAPEPLSNVGGVDFYGLDEISVFKNLLKVLKNLRTDNISIVIKAHPNQKKDLYENINPHNSLHIMNGDNLHVNTLLHHADAVIGIFSNILIEAAILKTMVIRCLIGLKKEDPFSHLQVGKVVNSESELTTLLTKIIN
jgi:predicted glycosyltransferase